jgi:hypothetical protein
VVSPKPIASRFIATSASQPMIVIAPAPAQAPAKALQGPANRVGSPTKTPTTAIASTKPSPKSVKPSGMR